jgi:hypothetical protein
MSSKLIRGLSIALAAVAITAGSAGAASAANREVTVVNSTDHTMTNLFASSVRDNRYHGDWLGRGVIHAGYEATIDFDDGTGACLMDVKAVFSDRTSVTGRYNVCTGSTMRFTGH